MKLVNRLVAFLLIPCLVADPISASVFSNHLSTSQKMQGERLIFVEQAFNVRAESGSGELKPQDVAGEIDQDVGKIVLPSIVDTPKSGFSMAAEERRQRIEESTSHILSALDQLKPVLEKLIARKKAIRIAAKVAIVGFVVFYISLLASIPSLIQHDDTGWQHVLLQSLYWTGSWAVMGGIVYAYLKLPLSERQDALVNTIRVQLEKLGRLDSQLTATFSKRLDEVLSNETRGDILDALNDKFVLGRNILDAGISEDALDEQTARDLRLDYVFGTTDSGRTVLANERFQWLIRHPYLDGQFIRLRQGAVKSLINQAQERRDIGALFKGLRDKTTLENLRHHLQTPKLFNRWRMLQLMLRGSLLFAGIVVFAIIQYRPYLREFASQIMLLVMLTVLVAMGMSTALTAEMAGKPGNARGDWIRLFQVFDRMKPVVGKIQDPFLQRILQEMTYLLSSENPAGLSALKRRHSVANFKEASLHRMESLRKFAGLFAELEVLYGLAEQSVEEPGIHAMPEILNRERPELSMSIAEGYPAWIPVNQSVGNDVMLGPGRNFIVATGPNANGKSTLLRMVAINAIRAQIGGTVRARDMSLTPVHLRSQMNIADDIHGRSRFQVEVGGLVDIMEKANDDPFYLLLFDEMLGGTNSGDKNLAQHASIPELLDSGALAIVTTHDMDLTHIQGVVNYHFTEAYTPSGDFVRSYKLSPGPATGTNAIDLFDRLLNRLPRVRERLHRLQAARVQSDSATAPAAISDPALTTEDEAPLVLFNHPFTEQDIRQSAYALQILEPLVPEVIALISEIIELLSTGDAIGPEHLRRLTDLVSIEHIETISKDQSEAFIHFVGNRLGGLGLLLEVYEDSLISDHHNLLKNLFIRRDDILSGLEIFRAAARRAT